MEQPLSWMPLIRLLDEWERERGHLDDLLDRHDPGHGRWLVREVFENWLIIERVIAAHVRKDPRPLSRHILRLAVAECIAGEEGQHARVVHHAVNTARRMGLSESECRFVNAVLRSMVRDGTLSEHIGLLDTHPEWLVERWQGQFGEQDCMRLIEWNQSHSTLLVQSETCPVYAEPTEWQGYYRVRSGMLDQALDDLRKGAVYAQDPFARIPVDLLSLSSGEQVLDLCAAPGGKSRLLSRAVGGSGRVVALERPGKRFSRLRENASRFRYGNVTLCECRLEDFTGPQLAGMVGSPLLPAVLIDVPCSNTGVMQKRPDVKLRLRPVDIDRQAQLQLKLLTRAARFVAPGGRLVYSTCSLEREENADVIDAFLEACEGWSLSASTMSYPWHCEHDGGGAFLLTRDSSG